MGLLSGACETAGIFGETGARKAQCGSAAAAGRPKDSANRMDASPTVLLNVARSKEPIVFRILSVTVFSSNRTATFFIFALSPTSWAKIIETLLVSHTDIAAQ